MNMKINENFLNLSENFLFSLIAKKVKQYKEANPTKEVISLGIGDVSLPLSKVVVDALVKASLEMGVKETFRGYPPEFGYNFVKDAIRKYYLKNSVDLSLDEIFVCDGAKSDLGNMVEILGDNRIIIPDPVYPVYVDSNMMAGRNILLLEGNKSNGFLPMPDGLTLEESVIYLCSPNNPTGAVYSKEQLKVWVDFAIKSKSLIIFDSAYEAFIRGNYPHSIFEIEGARKCAVEISSFSKLAGFTGLRCSYSIVPKDILDGVFNRIWGRRQATKFNGVAWPVQKAAEAALSSEGLKACENNINYYLYNALMIEEVLKKNDIYYTGGTNSPYIWMKCPNNMSSWDFFDKLLTEANIVGTPGVGFGKSGDGYFRLTSFSTREKTIEACKRLDKFFKEMK
ncbi:MAG: LL-diaminopimelate aminotransferase [bacterium]|nr:LL-diaminopimelate aminotransferase [bacterium]